MMWLARRRDSEEIASLVRINDRLQIQVGTRSYLTRVEDIKTDEIHIAVPIDHGSLVALSAGLELKVNIFTPMGLRQFRCSVKQTLLQRVPIVSLHKFRDLGVQQQRAYGRVQDELPVRFRRDACESSAWRTAIACDISGGGLQVVAEDVWILNARDIIEVELAMPQDGPIRAIAQIARIVPVPEARSKSRIAIDFINIDEAERNRLLDHISCRRKDLSNIRSPFVQCCDEASAVLTKRTRQDGNEPSKQGRVYELSTSGLRMAVPDATGLLTDMQLDTLITLPGAKMVEALAEVAHIRPARKGQIGKHEVGLRFVVVYPGSKERLIDFLSQVRGDTKAKPNAA
jgi:c-di-GMP-binding flagellar brake protein YcgR